MDYVQEVATNTFIVVVAAEDWIKNYRINIIKYSAI